MAMYFCQDCQQFKDDDYHPMSERELCPDCEAEREYRLDEFMAELSKDIQEQTESRHAIDKNQ